MSLRYEKSWKKNLISILSARSELGNLCKQRGCDVRIKNHMLLNIGLSTTREFEISNQGPITWMDIESIENRYVLTASADRQIALYDMAENLGQGIQNQPALPGAGGPQKMKPVFRRRKASKATVSSIEWYPIDTGLFVTSSMDGFVQIWDTNVFSSVSGFRSGCKVYRAALSPCAKSHSLVALGSDHNAIRLGDLSSEGWTHQLVGHTDEVWAVEWSPTNEYILASGGMDRTVRLWDVRRSGASACLLSLCAQNDILGHGAVAASPPLLSLQHSDEGGDPSQRHKRRCRRGPQFSQASDFARAHSRPINAITFTPDGLFLLSSAMDGQLRCWNTTTGEHQLINYMGIKGTTKRQFKMATISCGRAQDTMLFYPNGEDGEVLLFDVHSRDGKPRRVLQGHFDGVNCCQVRGDTLELVTGGKDGMLVLWEYYHPTPSEDTGTQHREAENMHSNDEWSDDEDGDSSG
mmetsp:Transcript_22310/g.29179  ORF Transcript_22310/g.29179 Transcript_22310/m.29179 type:complete len:465 (-) Transcript_22310:122-1516(-)